MSSLTPPPPARANAESREAFDPSDDTIDLADLFRRLGRGIFQIVGLALIGLVLAALISLAISRVQPVATSTRVTFSFPGFERGEYPDKSKFQADDLRAPIVVSEAIRRLGLDLGSDFQSKIRGALGVEGIVPDAVVKSRDRMRAAGQTPPAYTPDEYLVTLTLDRSFSLPVSQRARLLIEIVNVYREQFSRTFGQAPVAFGTAFETLHQADFSEFELILNSDLENIRAYLDEQQKVASSFRALSTNFSFKDLREQTDLFSQIHVNEVLGLIHQNGLSRNRQTAMVKMEYYLRQLEDREKHALDDEKVVRDLLNQTQQRAQNVVLGVKSQAAQPRGDAPVLDQGLIDSLLANDAYSFLVRRALDAGLKVKDIQAEKNRLLDLRDNMKSFIESKASDQTEITKQVEASLKNLEANYGKLIANIRRTQGDFAAQQYGDAIRLSDQVRTPGMLRSLAIAGVVGGFLGFALGAGMSLLGIYIGKRQTA